MTQGCHINLDFLPLYYAACLTRLAGMRAA